MTRVRVKICGVKRPRDAEAAISLGADFLGLNFWPRSPRCLDLQAAQEIAELARGRTGIVGVFVNQPAARIEEIDAAVGLDLLQLHGDEQRTLVAAFAPRVLKVMRFSGAPERSAFAAFPDVWGFLVEGRSANAYGGVGQRWDYAAARGLAARELAARPLLIAGGLGPENVGSAIAAGRPWGVDVASGVESAPGIKDMDKLERFFEEVRHAAD